MKSIKEEKIKDKRILLRVDFNVPIKSDGGLADDTRIRAGLPTIKYLLKAGAKQVVLVSHLGRPVVRPKERIELISQGNPQLTLKNVAQHLAKLLKISSPISKETFANLELPVYKLSDKLFLIENIRFVLGEERNDPDFARAIANSADIFVNDAFAVSHREHASVVGVANYLPARSGLLLEKEIDNLSQLTQKPEHPFVLVLGGAKVLDKMLVLKNLSKKIDFVLLGGVMANTFLKTRQIDLKKSLVERERLELAGELFDLASRKFILPTDFVWEKDKVVDIGSNTILHYQRIIAKAKTVLWNGPMGLISYGAKKFAKGTEAIAEAMANSSAITLVCGGDTIVEVERLHLQNKFSFLSTGGGASLEFLAGEKLPGLEALDKES